MATTIKAEPFKHNAALYFQDHYSVFGEQYPSLLSYTDFYSWLEKEWGCTFPPIIGEGDEIEYLIFEDEKKASLFILRFG